MRLWILKARMDLPKDDDPWNPWYDKTFGMVIRAKDEEQARALAHQSGSGETYSPGGRGDATPWLQPKYSTCEPLTARGPIGLILEDHRAA